jgi:hypothetical protein
MFIPQNALTLIEEMIQAAQVAAHYETTEEPAMSAGEVDARRRVFDQLDDLVGSLPFRWCEMSPLETRVEYGKTDRGHYFDFYSTQADESYGRFYVPPGLALAIRELKMPMSPKQFRNEDSPL